jgi:hypothetical protein
MNIAHSKIDAIEDMAGQILPFSLLGRSLVASALCEEVATSYKFDAHLIEDIYPCTPMQEELLSLTTVRPGNYIMRVVLELAPNMSLNKFCAAWEDIVRATAILRTTTTLVFWRWW